MHKISILFLLLLAASCEYGSLKYGYYLNPITVLQNAEESLNKNDLAGWSDTLSEKALCSFGSAEGMKNVNSALKLVDEKSLTEPRLKSVRHLNQPQYIGYWSYYQETYESEALDHQGKVLLKATILCNFGKPDNKTRYLNNPTSAYSTRSCSIVSIKNFIKPLKTPSYCL